MFKKNTAVTGFVFGLVSSTDGSDITTGTPVGYYTLDGGTQTAIGDVTPVHEGNGQWSLDLLAAEMNGDIVGLTFTHASAITAHFTIKTDTKITSELNDVAATDIVSSGAITTSTGAVSTVSTLTGHTAQTADHTAGIADIPTVAEFNARTLVAASYFDPAADTVANVTLVATTTINSDMRGTDSAALASVATEVRLSELDQATAGKMANQVDIIQTDTTTDIPATITTMQGNVTSILGDTNELQVDWTNGGRLDLLLDQVITDIAALNNISAAQVNTEVADVLNTDTLAELSAVPAANASVSAKINWLFALSRNKGTQTSTAKVIRNDADTANIASSTVSSDGTTFTRGEYA